MSFRDLIEGDTFTLVARCERTGMFGIALATRPIAVASRCPFVKARVGAVSIQADPDPRLGPLAIKLLEMGYSAPKVVEELKESDSHIESRQVGVVDKDGNSAAYTGSKNLEWAGHIAKKNYIAMGNYLVGERTVTAMAEAFETSAGETLEERLMRAIEAGGDAGGQHHGQFSAGLIVYDSEVFPRVDLRVDYGVEPIRELRHTLELYKPLIPFFLERPSNPTLGLSGDWLRKHASEKDLKRYKEAEQYFRPSG